MTKDTIDAGMQMVVRDLTESTPEYVKSDAESRAYFAAINSAIAIRLSIEQRNQLRVHVLPEAKLLAADLGVDLGDL